LHNADFSEILAFTEVVRGGSFTRAAENLRMPKSTLSRKVAELEERLGARLLQRTTRKVNLTDIGRAYYEHAMRVVSELEQAQELVSDMQATPKGVLRITTPITFGVLGPLIAEYLRLYPEVQVELSSTGKVVDLVEERFDLALRAGHASDSSLVGRKVGVVRRCVLGAPELVKRIGRLKHPSELERHDCLVFAPEGNLWRLNSGSKEVEVLVRSRLQSNDYDMLRSVASSGFGFSLLPEYQCIEDVRLGRLTRALENWSALEIPIYALHPSTRHVPPKVTAFLDLVRDRLALTLTPT